MVIWKDKRKRGADSEVESSEARFGRFKLVVHRHIHYPPDVWLASAYDLFSQTEMGSKDLGEAKEEALGKVRRILEAALAELG